MANKKYQIFVSSTYEDLKEERKAVIEQILNIGHMPVGMELFVASDDEQFKYIKRIIDNCDYYVLIIGGKYGSISPNTGISYTEMEYNYAIEKNIPILIFPFENVETLPETKRDKNLINVLNFINNVSKNRLHKTWSNKDNLCLNVINSLHNAFDEKPQKGWIRPDECDNTQLLKDINELRKSNINLENKLKEYEQKTTSFTTNIADLDEIFEIKFKRPSHNSYNGYYAESCEATWNDIFAYIAPTLISPISAISFKRKIDAGFINRILSKQYSSVIIEEDIIQTIKIQFFALDLINVYSAKSTNEGMCEFINLTQKGLQYLKQIKTIKTTKTITQIDSN